MVESLEVELGDRSYPIVIGKGVMRDRGLLLPHVVGREVCVVTNATVAPLYLDTLRATLGAASVDVCVLPDGETYKTLTTYARVIDHLMTHRHSRATTVVALGGGVVGDIAGFVAATYQRGVALVQVPTTLLAQVDSSVGGKTGVNHPTGKNMIGAFYQPRCVLVDTDTLASLPPREYLAGVAEVIKYGVIVDPPFFDWLEANVERLVARDPVTLVHAIRTSCAIKAKVVGADERESGERAILNFGHTFAHAIEAVTGFAELLHGEAVSIGMVMAADLSARLGWLPVADARRVKGLLERVGLPVRPPDGLEVGELLAAMAMDKKAIDGKIRLVLAEALGRVVVTDRVEVDAIRSTLARGEALCHG